MKLAVVTMIIFLLKACDNSTVPNGVELNREFRLKFHESAFLKSENMTILFSSLIQDSRCPKDVQCITAGEAVIELELGKGKEKLSAVRSAPNQAQMKLRTVNTNSSLLTLIPIPLQANKRIRLST